MKTITIAIELHHNIPFSKGQNPPSIIRNVVVQEVPDDYDIAAGLDQLSQNMVHQMNNNDAIYTTHSKTGINYMVPKKYITHTVTRQIK